MMNFFLPACSQFNALRARLFEPIKRDKRMPAGRKSAALAVKKALFYRRQAIGPSLASVWLAQCDSEGKRIYYTGGTPRKILFIL